MSPKICITILYALGAVLPLYGIGHALGRVARPALDHRSHQKKVKALQKERDRRIAAADDKSKAEASASYWIQDELKKIKSPGETSYLGFVNNNSVSYQRFKGYLYDLGFVGGGIAVAAGAASIWSLWL